MKLIDVLWNQRWEVYRKKTAFWRTLFALARVKPDYSVFVAGILSGIPATFILEISTMRFAEIRRAGLYLIFYGLCILASLSFCAACFRLSVLHGEVHREAEKLANRGHGTEEEKINELVISFDTLYLQGIRKGALLFIGSGVLTFGGIVALALTQNL